jgi:Na+-driven multidrug efflux pump
MNSNDPGPSLLRMTGPLIISFWMRAVVTFVDTIYASQIGDDAVAAIGLTIPFDFLLIAVWVGFSSGLTANLSKAMGGRRSSEIEQYLAIGWKMIRIISPIFMLFGVLIWLVAPAMNLDASVARNFQVYGSVLIGGSALTTFWSIVPDSLIKAHQDTRSSMWAGIWSNLINVTLNTLFVFVFHWGVFGIAFSTVLGRMGGLAYAVARARWHETQRKAAHVTVDNTLAPHPLRNILSIAVPSTLSFALMSIEAALVNAFLATLQHATAAIASFAIYYRVVLFTLQPVIALGVAMLPFAGKRFGAGDLEGIRRGVRTALLFSSAYSVILLGPLMYFIAPWMAEHLTSSEITKGYTSYGLRMVPLACLTGSAFLFCRPVFEAMGRGKPGLWTAVLRYIVLTGPLVFLGNLLAMRADQPPLIGIILGLILAAGISSLVFYLWLKTALRPGALKGG